MAFVDIPITTDQATLQDDAHAYVQGKVPDYRLDPAHPMTWLIEACGRMVAVALFQASLMPSANMRTLGQTVYRIQRGDGAPATAALTITATDTLGHLIKAGTPFLIDGFPFTSNVAVTIPSGSSSTAAGEVTVTATDVGEAGNDLGASVDPADALAWVDSVAIVGTTANGANAETDQEYQDRLVRRLARQSRRAVTVDDFVDFSVETDDGPRAGVGRAAGIDLLDATDPAAPVEDQSGHVTIVVHDDAGQPCTSEVKAAIVAELEARRILNIVVHVVDPTYTDVTIAYTVTGYDGFDHAALQASIDAALTSYFDPALWGQPPFGDTSRWVNQTVVRYLQVARVIENVEGVEHIGSLTVNGGTSDVTLTGIGPLPDLQTIATHTVS